MSKDNRQIIGVVGGLGPAASNYFVQLLTDSMMVDSDQKHPEILHFSNPKVPDRTDYVTGDGEDPVPELRRTVSTLVEAGASYLCMPCNTAHSSDILSRTLKNVPVPFIDMVAATASVVENLASKDIRAMVLATEGTVSSGVYSNALSDTEVKHVEIEPALQQDVSRLIYDIKRRGKTSHDAKDLLRIMSKAPADLFILGCTELSLLYDDALGLHAGAVMVDSLRCLVQAVQQTLRSESARVICHPDPRSHNLVANLLAKNWPIGR